MKKKQKTVFCFMSCVKAEFLDQMIYSCTWMLCCRDKKKRQALEILCPSRTSQHDRSIKLI